MDSTKAITHFYNEWSFLSNFAASAITIDGRSYATVEHWYQSQKTLDPERRELIRMARTPGQAKKLGNDRRLTAIRPDWDDIKDDVMLRGLREKFKDAWLREHLLETGDANLIEGNTWHDNYWGACSCKRCLGEPKHNFLGVYLMAVREEIRHQKDRGVEADGQQIFIASNVWSEVTVDGIGAFQVFQGEGRTVSLRFRPVESRG